MKCKTCGIDYAISEITYSKDCCFCRVEKAKAEGWACWEAQKDGDKLK